MAQNEKEMIILVLPHKDTKWYRTQWRLSIASRDLDNKEVGSKPEIATGHISRFGLNTGLVLRLGHKYLLIG